MYRQPRDPEVHPGDAARIRELHHQGRPGPYYTMIMLYYTILYYTILYYTILYYTILYYTILYYTILYYTILYYTILHTIPILNYVKLD